LALFDINAGGGRSTSGFYSVSASTAQGGGGGALSSGDYLFLDGFWFEDLAVRGSRYEPWIDALGEFVLCLSGTDLNLEEDCAFVDLNSDNHGDLRDFALFQILFLGP